MANLSRVQLAAALIEYDNDSPYIDVANRHFARDSAILAHAGGRGFAPPSPTRRPMPMPARGGNRSSWETQREPELLPRSPSPPSSTQDFRRSTSPYLVELASAHTATPVVVRSMPKRPSALLDWQQPSTTSASTEPVSDSDAIVTLDGPAPPMAVVPPRPHSTQPLKGSPLAGAPTTSSDSPDPAATATPLQQRLQQRRPSFGGADLSLGMFNVPILFETSPGTTAVTSPTAGGGKRRFSFSLLNKKPSRENLASTTTASLAAAANAGVPALSEQLRQSIAALPRSLGGDSPSMARTVPRSRTASMGDWDGLMFPELRGHQLEQLRLQQQEQRMLDKEAGGSAIADELEGEVEFEGVYGPGGGRQQPQAALASTTRTRPVLAPLAMAPTLDDDIVGGGAWEHLAAPSETAMTSPDLLPSSSLLDTNPSMNRRPSSTYSMVSGSDLESPLSAIGSGGGGPGGQGAGVNGMPTGQPTPAMLHLPPLSAEEEKTLQGTGVFSGLDLDLGAEEELVDEREGGEQENQARGDHGPASGRYTPGGSFLNEIGRITPDLLSKDLSTLGNGGGGVSQPPSSTTLRRTLGQGDDDDDDEEEQLGEESWLPPPTQGRASRFDPKSQSITSMSGVSASGGTGTHPDRPGSAASSHGDLDDHRRRPGKPKARPTSLAHYAKSHRLATTPTSSIHLPAVLIMPSPLDPEAAAASAAGQPRSIRGGFIETATKPMPLRSSSIPTASGGPGPSGGEGGAASSHARTRSGSSFIASASAMAIPETRLSLAQRTFRASLVVDGRRGKDFLGGALEEGVRGWEPTNDDEFADPNEFVRKSTGPMADEDFRGPGALYGRSLMEVLEERKAAMRSKQRTFVGDSRPAMFTRTKSNNSLASTSTRPQSIHLNSTFPVEPGLLPPSATFITNLSANSSNPALLGSLLNPLDGSSGGVSSGAQSPSHLRPPLSRGASSGADRTSRSSVFGVDEIWERETREREEADRREAEEKAMLDAAEKAKIEAEEEKRRRKLNKKLGKKGGKKGGATAVDVPKIIVPASGGAGGLPFEKQEDGGLISTSAALSPTTLAIDTPLPASPRSPNRAQGGTSSLLPPSLTLGEISSSTTMADLLKRSDDDDSEWERPRGGDGASSPNATGSRRYGAERQTTAALGMGGWFASESEDDGSDRGKAPLRRKSTRKSTKSTPAPAAPRDKDDESSSDDEVPLAQRYNLSASVRSKPLGGNAASTFHFSAHTGAKVSSSDEEEEQTLAQVLEAKRKRQRDVTITQASSALFNAKSGGAAAFGGEGDDEDDVPLGLRHSRAFPSSTAPGEDDLPLGLTQAQHLQHAYYAAQQQQQQMYAFQQQQQQQQRMMALAMMGQAQQMQAAAAMAAQGPRPEEKVDRWRRGVATGEQ